MSVYDAAPPSSEEEELVLLRRLVAERTRERDAALEREKRSLHFLQQAAIGVLCINGQGLILEANASALELLGADAADVLGGRFEERIHPDDRAQYPLAALVCDPGPGRELRLLRKDGSCLPVELLCSPPEPPLDHCHIVFRDISVRRAAENAQRVCEASYRALFESAPLGIYRTTSDGRVLDINPVLARRLGAPTVEAAKAYYLDLRRQFWVDPARRILFLDLLEHQGQVEDFEYEVYRMDGSLAWFAANAQVGERFADGTFTIEGFARDITARKRAQQEAEARSTLLRVILDALPTPVFYKGTDGRYQGCNRAWEVFLGLPPGGAAGKTVDEVFPSAEAAVFHAMDDRLLAGSGCQIYETRITGRDGVRQVIISKAGYADDRGRPLGLVGVVTDITSRQEAEASRLQALEAAEAASRAKSSFLATMSHEIRTPLNGILGMLQLIMAADPAPDVADYARTALEAAEALLRILSDILDISRIESGHMALVAEPFDLSEVIRPVASSFAHEAASKGLAFVWNIAPDTPPRLVGDAGRLRQILYNLTANAIKYTSAGQVRLEVSPRPGESDTDGVAVHFVVADTGIGIPTGHLARVFEAFTQVDPSVTRPYGGSGLGLAIVKGLVDRMGGQLYLCSQEGQGTEIHVTLRFGRVVETQVGTPYAAGVQRLDGLRVLVVEDEKVNQLTARAMLGKLGCETTLVGNGQEALDILATTDFDCVLMDVQMPVLDGLEATRRLRRDRQVTRNPDLPVVALTAHAMVGDKEAILAAGMNAYLAKPVDMADLARVLAEVVRRAEGGA